MEPIQEAVEKKETENKWFVLRVLSGKERKIKEYLDIEIRRSGWGNTITQIMCPVEKVFKVVGGKKVMREKILYSGYILMEATTARLSDDMIQTIKNVSGVIHFLGKDHPDALRRSEVNKMFGKMDELADSGVSMSEPFIVGESVKIIDGPFNDFNGSIEEINDEYQRVQK
jgi:transcriptional antiterminator NusG